MGKDKSGADAAVKKEKKDKKRKHEDVEEDVSATPKKEKKSKKSRKSDVADESVMDIDNTEVSVAAPAKDEEEKALVAPAEVGIAALVPFANPLASEKDQKKVLKSVKKGEFQSPISPSIPKSPTPLKTYTKSPPLAQSALKAARKHAPEQQQQQPSPSPLRQDLLIEEPKLSTWTEFLTYLQPPNPKL